MSRLLTKITVLTALAVPLIAPGVASAQVCNPAGSSMNGCAPINDGGGARNDHRPDRMRPNGPDGMHPGMGMSGTPSGRAAGGFGGVGDGAHATGGGVGAAAGGALPTGAGHSGGMGHGGGGAAGGAGGGGHGK
jgi:hypothetical protein